MANAVSPYREMVAYETLWGQQNQSLRTLAEMFREDVSTPPAKQYVSPDGSVFLPARTMRLCQ